MSQKLDNLKKDFEYNFNNELKQDLLKFLSCSQELMLSFQRFGKENKSIVKEIENEMCGNGSCKPFYDYMDHIFYDDEDIKDAMEQFLDSFYSTKHITTIKDYKDSLDMDNLYYALEGAEYSIL